VPPSRPGRFGEAARWGLQAAQALAHAHQRGVVHRDVKPSNLLLDGDGTLWVTDFGLARRTGEDTCTVPGTVLGTPYYMSPEQARGESKGVDHRTDVYSLGATLYEALAGAPVFRGESHQQVIEQVHNTEPVPPRDLNPAVPRDLETICLKCLQKEPHRRYQTADALAEDLRRYLAGEPIRARRVGTAERVVRWARRRPAQAALAGVVALAVVVGTAWGVWYNVEVTEAKRQAEAAAGREREERKKAEQAEAEARQAAEKQREAREAAERAEAGERQARLEREEALEWLRLRGQRERRIFGDMVGGVDGGLADVLAQVKDLEAKLKKLKIVDGGNPLSTRHVSEHLGGLYFTLGALYSKLGRHWEAALVLDKAITHFQAMVTDWPKEKEYWRHRIGAAHNRGEALVAYGRLVQAENVYRITYGHQKGEVPKRFAAEPAFRNDLARTCTSLGNLLDLTGRHAEAQDYFAEAIALLRPVIARAQERPGAAPDEEKAPVRTEVAGYLSALANTYNSLGSSLLAAGQPEQAVMALEEALATLPPEGDRTEEGRQEKALVLQNCAWAWGQIGRRAEAEQGYAKALAVQQALVRDAPHVASHFHLQARFHGSRGNLRRAHGDPGGAAEDYREVVALLRRLTLESPDEARPHDEMARFLASCPDERFRDPARAVEHAQKAVAAARHVGLYHATLALARFRARDWRGAIRALDAAKKLNGPDPYGGLLRALVLWHAGDRQDARPVLERAAAAPEKAPPADPVWPQLRQEAADLLEAAGP
jgi:tetratricopeptide (TPR) repeat protein